jgi:AMMECR1 domain-containing protein
VILEIQGRRSTFLPEVWEEIGGAEDFLDALCRKQGRANGSWLAEDARLSIYHTQSR